MFTNSLHARRTLLLALHPFHISNPTLQMEKTGAERESSELDWRQVVTLEPSHSVLVRSGSYRSKTQVSEHTED